MPYAERNLPLSAALAACIGLFGLEKSALASEILIPGVETGSDILRALALAHDGRMRGELVLVPPPVGAGRAIADVIAGRATVARIDRPLRADELEAGLATRVVFTLPVRILGHPDLVRRDITQDELSRILDGSIDNWSVVRGASMPIRLVSRDSAPNDKWLRRWARAAYLADLVAVVRRSPGTLGLTHARLQPEDEALALTLDGITPNDPRYPYRVAIRFAYRPDRVTPAVEAFFAFLSSARAAELVSAYGAGLPRP